MGDVIEAYHKVHEADYLTGFIDTETSIVNPGAGTWVKIDSNWVENDRNNWSLTTAGVATFLGVQGSQPPLVPGKEAFQVTLSVGAKTSTGFDFDVFRFGYSLNGGAVDAVRQSVCWSFNRFRIEGSVYVFYISLVPGDSLEFWTQNVDNGSDLEIQRATLYAVSI